MKASEVLADIHADYAMWRKEIISLIERSKYQAALNVNAELLALYWKIGSDIIESKSSWDGEHKSSFSFPKICPRLFPMIKAIRNETSET